MRRSDKISDGVLVYNRADYKFFTGRGLCMNLSELLARSGRKYPEKIAVQEKGNEITYNKLDQQVTKFAHSLKGLGVSKGDKVMLFMPNTSSFLITYFAALRLEAIVVPVSARLTGDELTYMIDHSEAKVMVIEHMLYNACAALPSSFANVHFVKTGEKVEGWAPFEALLHEGDNSPLVCSTNEDDLSTMLYTSGTTGKPKGVMFSNRNVLTVATMMAIEMEMKPESKLLHMMPLSHSAPLHLFLAAGTYVGATHCLTPTFTPDLLLESVERWRTTHFFGAPVAYLLTAKNPALGEKDLSSMTHWIYGGSPLGKQEVSFLRQAFKSDRFYCVYGLTEAGPNGTLLLPEEHDEKAGSIGRRAALNAEIKLVDDKGDEVKTGEPGEIILRGEGNMVCYDKEPEKTAEAVQDGWLYTGDMAKRDEQGFYWVINRKKDMIISGGVNIFPIEIERVLSAHPDIAECAVIGVPHEDWGETVTAYVVVKEGGAADETAWTEFLQTKIADYKIPKQFHVIDQLPRNPTGKILKQHLRQKQSGR